MLETIQEQKLETMSKMGKRRKPCVFLSKVAMALMARTRERRDPHEAPRRRTKDKGASEAQEGRRKRIR